MASSSSTRQFNTQNIPTPADRNVNMKIKGKKINGRTLKEHNGSSNEENALKEYNRTSSNEEKTLKECNRLSDEGKSLKEFDHSSDEENKSKKLEEQKQKILRSFNARMQERERNHDLPHGLPLGYRFWPSEHELIKPYLHSKILGKPVPPHPIKDMKLSDFDPNEHTFDENCKPNETYFYACLEHKCVKGLMARVVTKSGYWEAKGGDVPVFSDKEEKIMVGFKKNWAFFWGEAPTGKKSLWSMSEFRVNPGLMPIDQLNDNLKFKMVNYAVCKIKKQSLGKDGLD